MKIFSIEVVTDLGSSGCLVKPDIPINVDPLGQMPPPFRELSLAVWKEFVKIRATKIYSIEASTDLGRRVVQLSAPIGVDSTGEMPQHFRQLVTDVLWGVMHQVALKAEELAAAAPKVEA